MKLRQVLLGTAVALGSAGAAEAAITTPTGWYLDLGAGANWVEDGSILEVQTGVPETTNQFSWDDGFVARGAVGYDFGRWRVEFEVAYRHNDSDGFCFLTLPTATSSGCAVGNTDLWELSQMVNVLYDISLGGNWQASVGAGVGGNLVVLTPTSAFDSSSAGLEADDYVLAGQLIAQVAYRLAERWQLYLDYHFMFMDDPELQDVGDLFETFEVEKTEHSLMLGVRFDLQRDGAAPPPPPPVEPARAPKQFIVFFGFNKAHLTPEAARVVADAADAAKQYGSASIVIVGHTDTSGSPKYNLRLSLRRADAVKSGLVQNGIPAGAITTSGRGEEELMVQTGDGVKEPQNRRATIDLN
jgi:outer membrane protein OmpA-like peptidoglycan-associated protein